MDYLQIIKYGNTIYDWLISLAIFAASVIISHNVYRIVLQPVRDWLFSAQEVYDREDLARVAKLAIYLIPMAGFALAQNRLVFAEELRNWMNIGLVLVGQIIFLLIIIAISQPMVEALPIRYMRTAARDNSKHRRAQEEAVGKIRKHTSRAGGALLILVPLLTVLTYMDRVHSGVWALPAAIVIINTLLCFRVMRLTKRKLKKPEITTIKYETPLETEPAHTPNDPDLQIKESIVETFLNIYKHQAGALKETHADFRLVDWRSFAPNYIYELRLKINDDWQTRRMTIGPLGEGTASRSKCFYVIYDYHLVIKIPPTAIKDLDEYMKIIKKERSIVNKLSLKECIIPSVSVILKMLQRFSKGAELPQGEVEETYIKWLDVFSEFQKYLKIGDTFAFFMDLSKYYFLQNIIEGFHTVKKALHDDVRLDSEIAWDSSKFESKYGSGCAPVFLEVEKVYRKYESDVKKLLEQYDISAALSQHQIKEWFFIHLAESSVTKTGKMLNAEFIATLNALVEKIVNDNFRAIQTYRAIVIKHIHASTFAQNKAYMEGVITNLLELLAYLRKKNVAMRDLKPDNLLVAGDREKYPAFLAYPEEYKIGLIDVETAVISAKSSNTRVDQPLLGGTPQYATPSHLFSNRSLSQVYGNLSLILHLQDWYAVIGMIYKTVAGQNLFEHTAQLFPNMVDTINDAPRKSNGLADVVINVSQIFWKSAASELNTKLAEKEKILKSLDVFIEDATRRMLKDFVLDEKQKIAQRIDQCVNSKEIPISARDRQYLLSCSREKTYQLRKKWQKRSEAKTATSLDRSRIITFLEILERLKSELDQKAQIQDLLDQSSSRISAHQLLEIMFDVVLKQMYREQWGVLMVDDSPEFASPDDENDYQPAVEVTREWPTVQA
jgi:serine/threonine protein kinase